MSVEVRKQAVSKNIPQDKQRNYNEIIEFLDKAWNTDKNYKSLDKIKKLDQALGNPSQKLNTILVGGTNGKSLTINLTAKLLKSEGLKVGAFYSPHILTYNERLAINNEIISNKTFAELANEIINLAESLEIEANSLDILTMMAIHHFVKQEVDLAIMESSNGSAYNPVNICKAKVATITRVAPANDSLNDEEMKETIRNMASIIQEGTWVVSGDQNKSHLQLVQELTKAQGGHWAMPIRKLVALTYPFEQLHGRCAALAERLAQMYVENFHNQGATIINDSLLSKQKGQRGRPSIETKRKDELNPKPTLEQFWKEECAELPGRFQLLNRENPSVLLDIASNLDAIGNILLGVRLLHYQRPLNGLTIILGATKNTLNSEKFIKLIRYFFKKTSGQLLICPIEPSLPGINENESWNPEQVANNIKSMKVKARACKDFEEAFELAKKSVNEKYGLIVVTGSRTIVSNYWKYKGIKKF